MGRKVLVLIGCRSYNWNTMGDKNDNSHYESVLLEEIHSDIQTLLEGQQSLAHVPGDLAQLKDDMIAVKTDIKTIKLVVKGQSKDYRALKRRVTTLERRT